MITEIEWCKKCLMPSSRPRIQFYGGVCNACIYHANKSAGPPDIEGFKKLVAENKRHPAYDCIVPFSGGKDSATIAYKLKFELGLNPLLVTYGQLMWTDVGRRNFDKVIDLGFDCIYWRVNQDVSRKLARRFFIERGHPKQHYDAGVNVVPIRTAIDMGIPLVVYAEHGESEYGGRILSEKSRRYRDVTEVMEHQVGDDTRNWATDEISERDLYPYIYPTPSELRGTKAVYFSSFFGWDIYDNARFARDVMGFEQAQSRKIVTFTDGSQPYPYWWGRSDGSFEGFDSIDDKIDGLDFYMMRIKFGFGRACRMASRMIQNGHMTRERGLDLVRCYDGEFPHAYTKSVRDYLGMELSEFDATIDLHRNSEIWKKEGAKWLLRNPPV